MTDQQFVPNQNPSKNNGAAQYDSGVFFGVGVGPGDPELLTLKAFKLIQSAPVIAYLLGESGNAQAKQIARLALDERQTALGPMACDEIVIKMPMSKDRNLANQAYDDGAVRIREKLKAGKDVVFLCEGDPLFFGSFAYLLERIQNQFPCQVVPGISSVNAASSALSLPLTMLKESFAVVSGRHDDSQIESALIEHDSVVIMKAGQARPRILKLLEKTGRTEEASYLEYIGRENEVILSDVNQLPSEPGPYFSIFVVLRSKLNYTSEEAKRDNRRDGVSAE